MLLSPQANLLNSLIDRITDKVPSIRYIEQDLKQLEAHERPPVSWPCCLIDIEQFEFTDMDGRNYQMAQGIICFRLGLVKYTDSNNLVPANIRENAFQYYEIENNLYAALQGWNPPGFSKLLRRMAMSEMRDDDLRVRVLKFATSYTDTTAAPVTTKHARPSLIINDGFENNLPIEPTGE